MKGSFVRREISKPLSSGASSFLNVDPEALAGVGGNASADTLKRGIDVAVALFVLLVAAPLILMVSACLLLAQGRPILIRHRRLGRGGRSFSCFKFRTMVVDGDDVLRRHLAENPAARVEWQVARKLKADPRVTAIGQVLRKSSIDELPQVLNILFGEMSLVGPRPIVEAETHHYGPHIHRYYQVRPGLTGLWQVSGRSDVSFPRRVQMDLAYVESRSLRKDMAIIARTIPAILRARGSY